MIGLRNADWKMENKDGIGRFVKAHENMYATAVAEIRNGRKESHWMWYIFPQLRGLGRTFNADYYGLSGVEEAKAYMEHPVLKAHMEESLGALLSLPTDDAEEIFGSLDAMKLRSSMTVFDMACPDGLFVRVLDKYFNGRRDNRTIGMVNRTIGG